ncbi:MAG: hypothetical protein RI967_793 [Planctomycetota bacterium]
MQILFSILTVLFFVVSVALVLIVLVQRPQGGGLTGAFGGGGGTDTAFGGRTGDALTVATITAFSIYLLLAIGLNITSNTIRNAPPEAVAEPAANTGTPDGTAPLEPAPMGLTPEEAVPTRAPTPPAGEPGSSPETAIPLTAEDLKPTQTPAPSEPAPTEPAPTEPAPAGNGG